MSAAFDLATKAANQSQKLARGVLSDIVVSSVLTLSDITIVPAETLRDELGEENEVISRRVQEWLITVSDCAGNIPKESWKITVNGETFKLLPFDDEKAYRFHNAVSNTVYRVHSVLVSGSGG